MSQSTATDSSTLITPVQWELFDRISEFLNFLRMNGVQLALPPVAKCRLNGQQEEENESENEDVAMGRLLLRFVKMSSVERQEFQFGFSTRKKSDTRS